MQAAQEPLPARVRVTEDDKRFARVLMQVLATRGAYIAPRGRAGREEQYYFESHSRASESAFSAAVRRGERDKSFVHQCWLCVG